jgi:sugar lactone lactonase YvrE
MQGTVNGIAWTDDNKKLIVVASGNVRCSAVSLDGKKAGEMNIGHNKSLLCVDIKNPSPHMAVFAGEE